MKRAKKWMGWLAVALAAATGAFSARGATETVDGVAWTYSVSGGKATIYSGNNFEAAIPTSTSGRIAIPAALGGHPVTAIGEAAFLECDRLTEVAIPDGVTCIGQTAFACCTSLTNMTIPDSVTRILDDAFLECFGLTEVVIPDSVTCIGAGAFYHCTGLKRITIGNGVTNIGSTAFCGCDDLAEVHIRDVAAWCGISFADPLANPQYLARHLYLDTEELSGHLEIPAGISRIEPASFYYCRNLTGVTIPGSVTNIGGGAFYGCSGLTNVAIGTNVAGIGDAAFYDCQDLESLAIPDSVTAIGSQAFRGCAGLTNVTIGANVADIGEAAFYGCQSLTSLAIPGSVTSIGSQAFRYCAGLTNVTAIPDGVTNIGPCAFSGCSLLTALDVSGGNADYASENGVLFDKNKEMLVQFPAGKGGAFTIPGSVTAIGDEAFYLCGGLTEVTIPDGVTHIGEGAFCYCSGLTEVTIPDGVTNLGAHAFGHCTGLTDMTVPDSVTSIGEETFFRCDGLTNVTIGANVTSIGPEAFEGCTNLASVTIPGSVMYIGINAFCNCPRLTELAIPGSVVRIGINAFYGCTGLTNAVIPDSVTYIGNHAFGDCSGLVRLEVPVAWYGTTKLADAGVRGNCRIVYRGMASETAGGGTWNYIAEDGSAVVMGGDYAGNLSIPETLGGYPVTGIGVAAFAGCTDLAALSIPDCVTEVGSNAFCGCSSLSALSVPEAWYGTPALWGADVPAECTVAYRGIEPLAVMTATLPRGTLGAPYEAALAAVGGISPCVWSVGNTVAWNAGAGKDYEESSASGTYAEIGTAQGWRGDDACWDLVLPFAFPFFGHSYTKAKINSNGAISFGTDDFSSSWYSSATFLKTPVIAVLWADLTTQGGDIHVETSSDAVAVRWTGRYWGGTDVAFSATLKADGTIVLSYGKGNANGGFIGISAGDGATATISARSNSGSMGNADDIVFKVPGNLPAGMELTEAGVLRGTPAAAGNYSFSAIVTDNVGVSASKELILAVAPSGAPGNETSTTPVPVPHVWLEKNAAGILAANGSDYEATASAPATNGLPVWKCYVAGLSTTNAEAAFKVKSISVVDGDVNVEWDPDLNGNGTPDARAYTVEGKPTMADAWGVTNASSRFFRVRVELPPPE